MQDTSIQHELLIYSGMQGAICHSVVAEVPKTLYKDVSFSSVKDQVTKTGLHQQTPTFLCFLLFRQSHFELDAILHD